MKKQILSRPFIERVVLVYLILQPIVDIGTSLLVRTGHDVTFGVVLRALFLAAVGVFLVFFYKGPRRKMILGYLAAVCGLALLQLVLNRSAGLSGLMTNVKETVKVFYFPCVLLGFWGIKKQYGYQIPDKQAVYVTVFYALTIFLSFITNTSFQSYSDNGYCGWFYAANEVSALVLIMTPLVIWYWTNRRAYDSLRAKKVLPILAGVFSVLLMLFASVYLGTKAAFLGAAAYLACFLIWCVFRLEITRDKLQLFRILAALLMGAALVTLYVFSSPIKVHLTERASWFYYIRVKNPDYTNHTTIVTTTEATTADSSDASETTSAPETTVVTTSINTDSKLYNVANWIMSNRLNNSRPVFRQFSASGPVGWLFGLGYAQRPEYTYKVTVALEMDFLTVLCRHGLAGLVLFTLPYAAILLSALVKGFRKFRFTVVSLSWCTSLYQVMIAFVVGFVSGHTFVAPAVSIYAVFTLLRLCEVTDAAIAKGEAEALPAKA